MSARTVAVCCVTWCVVCGACVRGDVDLFKYQLWVCSLCVYARSRYGVTVTDERDCDLRSLIGVNAPAQEFYDLYVVDYTKTDEIAAGTVGSCHALCRMPGVCGRSRTAVVFSDESTGLPTYLYPVPVRNVNYM